MKLRSLFGIATLSLFTACSNQKERDPQVMTSEDVIRTWSEPGVSPLARTHDFGERRVMFNMDAMDVNAAKGVIIINGTIAEDLDRKPGEDSFQKVTSSGKHTLTLYMNDENKRPVMRNDMYNGMIINQDVEKKMDSLAVAAPDLKTDRLKMTCVTVVPKGKKFPDAFFKMLDNMRNEDGYKTTTLRLRLE